MYLSLLSFDSQLMNRLYSLVAAIGIGMSLVFFSCKNNDSGCTDPKADNYNYNAVKDDGSCLYNGKTFDEVLEEGGFTDGNGDTVFVGCMDTAAVNYDPNATVPGPCYFVGCTDSTAVNFDPKATLSNNASCVYAGCTDPDSDNYNPKATIDDGSCIDVRQKFVGDWDVSSDCGFQFPLSGAQSISIVTGTTDEILFTPFIGGGDATGLISVKEEVDIPLTTQGIYDYTGSGEINAARDEIVINFAYENNIPFIGGPGNCTATYVKQ